MATEIDLLPTTWFPIDPIDNLLDNWFSPSWPAFPNLVSRLQSVARGPVIDVTDEEKQVMIRAEIPGINERDIDISHENGVLYLKGEKKGETEEKKNGSRYRESWYGSFSRSLNLGDKVDWTKVDAKHKDGILTITIPKLAGSVNRKKIAIH